MDREAYAAAAAIGPLALFDLSLSREVGKNLEAGFDGEAGFLAYFRSAPLELGRVVEHVGNCLADHLIGRISEHHFRRAVEFRDGATGVGCDDRVGGAVHQGMLKADGFL